MEEIGRRLQAARLAQGLTLQQVEDETRIRKKYLEALETGRLADIPGEVYVKGFLRAYGNLLGLDGDELVEGFKQAMAAKAAAEAPAPPARSSRTVTARRREAIPTPTPAQAQASAQAAAERSARRQAARGRARSAPNASVYAVRRLAVALLILLPLAGGGYWLATKYKPSDATTPPAPAQEPVVEAPKPEPVQPTPQPAPEPPKPVVTTEGAKGTEIRFEVAASAATVEMVGFRAGYPWISVFVDGKEVFRDHVKGPMKWEGKEIVIHPGLANGVDYIINGETFVQPISDGPTPNKVTVAIKN